MNEDWTPFKKAYEARIALAEARVAVLEAALRESGCQFYIDGPIGACQQYAEANPCSACTALTP